MTIKIGNDYFKVIDKGCDVEDDELLKKVLFCLKVAKITMDVCENYVRGDDASYLDNSDENRAKMYNQILSNVEFGKNKYPRLKLLSGDLKIEVL